MAHLNDRGQLILIAAFALAVTFVAISLVVNSAIFTENLATRGETTGGSDTLLLRHEVEQDLENVSAYVSEHNETAPIAAVNDSTQNLSVQSAVQNARLGRVVSVGVVGGSGQFDATVLQTNGSRSYVNASDETDWTLVDGADRLDELTVNVSEATTSDSSDAFTLVLGDTGAGPLDTWKLSVYDGPYASSYNVTVDDRGVGTQREVINGSYVLVNVTDRTITNATATTSYPSLLNIDHSSGTNETTFEKADRVEGTYTIDYRNPEGLDELDFNQTASPVYNVTIDSLEATFRYETADLRYNTTVAVRPGEDDA